MHSQCERPVGPLDKSIVGRRSDSQDVIEISASIRIGTKDVLHRRGMPASHSIAGVASCSVGQNLFLQLHVLADHHDMKVERCESNGIAYSLQSGGRDAALLHGRYFTVLHCCMTGTSVALVRMSEPREASSLLIRSSANDDILPPSPLFIFPIPP